VPARGWRNWFAELQGTLFKKPKRRRNFPEDRPGADLGERIGGRFWIVEREKGGGDVPGVERDHRLLGNGREPSCRWLFGNIGDKLSTGGGGGWA